MPIEDQLVQPMDVDQLPATGLVGTDIIANSDSELEEEELFVIDTAGDQTAKRDHEASEQVSAAILSRTAAAQAAQEAATAVEPTPFLARSVVITESGMPSANKSVSGSGSSSTPRQQQKQQHRQQQPVEYGSEYASVGVIKSAQMMASGEQPSRRNNRSRTNNNATKKGKKQKHTLEDLAVDIERLSLEAQEKKLILQIKNAKAALAGLQEKLKNVRMLKKSMNKMSSNTQTQQVYVEDIESDSESESESEDDLNSDVEIKDVISDGNDEPKNESGGAEADSDTGSSQSELDQSGSETDDSESDDEEFIEAANQLLSSSDESSSEELEEEDSEDESDEFGEDTDDEIRDLIERHMAGLDIDGYSSRRMAWMQDMDIDDPTLQSQSVPKRKRQQPGATTVEFDSRGNNNVQYRSKKQIADKLKMNTELYGLPQNQRMLKNARQKHQSNYSPAYQKTNDRDIDMGVEVLRALKNTLHEMVVDKSLTMIKMDPIGSKPLRKYIHEMARQYGITSNSTGQGENRFITLTRSKKCHFTTQRKVDLIINNYVEEELLNGHQIDEDGCIMSRREKKELLQQRKQRGKQKIKRNEKQQQKQSGMGGKNSHAFVKPAIGTVVGQHVAPIGSTNIGHQLLAKMGWSSGQALGSTGDGITAPIEAMVRSKREGLGS